MAKMAMRQEVGRSQLLALAVDGRVACVIAAELYPKVRG